PSRSCGSAGARPVLPFPRDATRLSAPVPAGGTLHDARHVHTTLYGAPPGTWRRLKEAMWQRPEDPDLEALRRAVWRRHALVALWVFGFPLLTFGVAVLLAVNGLVHPH